jgi:hypothetical protein
MDTANYARTLIYSNAAASYVGGKEKVYSNQNWLINNNNVLQFNMICKEEFMKNYYTTAGDTEYSFGVNDQDRSKISQSYCFGTEINLRKFVFS